MCASFKPTRGVRVFYQFGVTCRLRAELSPQEMEQLQVYGASCGALAAVFLKANVDVHKATQLAFDLCVKNGVLDRPAGLMGIWGPIIESWLHEVLPDNAHELCSGSTHIQLLTESGKPLIVSDFGSKVDLIHTLLASTHIPLVLDGKLFRSIGGKRYLDGFILGEIPGGDHCHVLSFPEHVSRTPIVKMIDLDTALAHVKFGAETVPSAVFVKKHEFPIKHYTCFRFLFRLGLFVINLLVSVTSLFACCCRTSIARKHEPEPEVRAESPFEKDVKREVGFLEERVVKAGKICAGLEVWVVERGVKGLHIRQGVVQRPSARTEHLWSEEHWRLAFASLATCGDYPASRIHLSRDLASRALKAIAEREGPKQHRGNRPHPNNPAVAADTKTHEGERSNLELKSLATGGETSRAREPGAGNPLARSSKRRKRTPSAEAVRHKRPS